jgi:hypothetical protein
VLLGDLAEDRLEQLLLVREVVVEQRLGDARLAGDLGHRQLVVSVRREQLGRALEQLLAPLVDLKPGVGGGAHGLKST